MRALREPLLRAGTVTGYGAVRNGFSGDCVASLREVLFCALVLFRKFTFELLSSSPLACAFLLPLVFDYLALVPLAGRPKFVIFSKFKTSSPLPPYYS